MKRQKFIPTTEHPLLLIVPPARRAALQERIKSIPRYAAGNPYHTHAALTIIEEQVSAGKLPRCLLDNDDMIFGAVAFRALARDEEQAT